MQTPVEMAQVGGRTVYVKTVAVADLPKMFRPLCRGVRSYMRYMMRRANNSRSLRIARWPLYWPVNTITRRSLFTDIQFINFAAPRRCHAPAPP